MVIGLRNIIRLLMILLLILFLTACMPNRVKIADLQSEIVTLSVQCNNGNNNACNILSEKKLELKQLLE
jgi:hypothetical protein